MIDNIKSLFKQLNNKTEFILLVANEFDKSPRTIRGHWFSNSGFWSIPEQYQARTVELLQNAIALQNKNIEVVDPQEIKTHD